MPIPTFQLVSTTATTTAAPSSGDVQSPTATSYFTWDSGTFGSTDDPFSIGTAAADPFSIGTSTTAAIDPFSVATSTTAATAVAPAPTAG